jgi:hypothetical protein
MLKVLHLEEVHLLCHQIALILGLLHRLQQLRLDSNLFVALFQRNLEPFSEQEAFWFGRQLRGHHQFYP